MEGGDCTQAQASSWHVITSNLHDAGQIDKLLRLVKSFSSKFSQDFILSKNGSMVGVIVLINARKFLDVFFLTDIFNLKKKLRGIYKL